MYYDLRFPYRIGSGEEALYMQIKAGQCKKPITEEGYKERHEQQRKVLAEMLGVPADNVYPISGQEYEENADEEGEG